MARTGVKPRLLIADLYYERVLDEIMTAINPNELCYEDLIKEVLDFGFGTSGALQDSMAAHGWDVHVSVVNSPTLQNRWNKENTPWLNKFALTRVREIRGVSRIPIPGLSWQQILISQVRASKPNILLLLDPSFLRAHHRKKIQSLGTRIVAQSAVPLPSGRAIQGYDAFLSSLPKNVALAQGQGIPSYFIPHAFWPGKLPTDMTLDRTIDVLFYGTISARHQSTIDLLLTIAQSGIEVHAYCDWPQEVTAPSNLILKRPVWGPQLRDVISRSKIVINRHMDYAQNSSNNMRMFEATGLGALLLTETSLNIEQLFAPGIECRTYESFFAASWNDS